MTQLLHYEQYNEKGATCNNLSKYLCVKSNRVKKRDKQFPIQYVNSIELIHVRINGTIYKIAWWYDNICDTGSYNQKSLNIS